MLADNQSIDAVLIQRGRIGRQHICGPREQHQDSVQCHWVNKNTSCMLWAYQWTMMKAGWLLQIRVIHLLLRTFWYVIMQQIAQHLVEYLSLSAPYVLWVYTKCEEWGHEQVQWPVVVVSMALVVSMRMILWVAVVVVRNEPFVSVEVKQHECNNFGIWVHNTIIIFEKKPLHRPHMGWGKQGDNLHVLMSPRRRPKFPFRLRLPFAYNVPTAKDPSRGTAKRSQRPLQVVKQCSGLHRWMHKYPHLGIT